MKKHTFSTHSHKSNTQMKTSYLFSSLLIFNSLIVGDINVGVLPFEYLPHWNYIGKDEWTGFYGNLLKVLEEKLQMK